MTCEFKMKASLTILASLLLAATASAREAPYLYILGIGQDGAYPQAGCFRPHCMPGWENPELRHPATSMALITEGSKYLFEATPNVPEQLYMLQQEAPDATHGLAGVFLTHAHVGHYAGLLHFGFEVIGADKLPVYAMPRMSEFLRSNGPWSQMVDFNNIALQPLQHQSTVSVNGVKVTPFLVPHRDEYSETVGYRIEGPTRSALFIPDINKWDIWEEDISEQVLSVDYALIDATFYADGELGNRDMSQIPHPFVSESMARFSSFSAEDRGRVWFIHINHTNPLLNENSAEYEFVISEGYNVAREGIRLPL
jgi:pyrroloquinoline quinone biosynthesis protein B